MGRNKLTLADYVEKGQLGAMKRDLIEFCKLLDDNEKKILKEGKPQTTNFI